jgi:hypothetical protein
MKTSTVKTSTAIKSSQIKNLGDLPVEVRKAISIGKRLEGSGFTTLNGLTLNNKLAWSAEGDWSEGGEFTLESIGWVEGCDHWAWNENKGSYIVIK